MQGADETTPQYVAALRELATRCNFGEMESQMIRDQLISSAYPSAVKDKLLLEEDLTLDKAQVIACRVEEAVKNASLLSSATTPAMASVQAISASNAHFRGKRGVRPAKPSADRRA